VGRAAVYGFSMTAWRLRAVLLPDGDVVEAGITAAGRWTSTPTAGAEVLPGRFALPGLVDAHCHLSLGQDERAEPVGLGVEAAAANLAAARAAGVTAVRDTGSPGGVTLRLVAGDDGGELLVCGRFLAPAGQYFPGLYEPVPAEDLVAAALAEVAAGARWVKLVGDFPVRQGPDGPWTAPVPTYSIDEVRRLVDAVHAAGARVAAHTTSAHVKALIEAGIDSVEHGFGMDDDDLAALASRGGAWTPTLCAFTAAPPSADDGERHERYLQARDRLNRLLPVAADLGVTIMTGTDVVGTVAREVALLAAFGLAPAAALAAATTAARRFLGLAGLTEGQPVDVVTYHDDPRDDPDVLARPAAVMARGVRIR
jgi:imidazolonepropionase-like amidohydrolase